MADNILRPIETAPRDGALVILWNKSWDMFPKAYWEWIDCPDEHTGVGGVCLWHVFDDYPTAMGDALLWPEHDQMPTHWIPFPRFEDAES